MRLTEILEPACVKVPLGATDKESAINELVDLLCNHKGIANREELKRAIWQREQTRTTGIGHGVAIPHGKCASSQQLIMAVGSSGKPIDFKAIDGRPIELIFLLVSPQDQTGPHIQALATISRMLINADFRAALKKATSGAALYRVIEDEEAKMS